MKKMNAVIEKIAEIAARFEWNSAVIGLTKAPKL